ncbi:MULTISPECIES: DUF1150 family protein [Paracoccus]|uniref:DUF1150 domain-containing protein n=1 Tax=Paracoccus versutus TaxID=34007 RepID=A0A3D9X9M8_PARVE|nr:MULTISPECIES: DUF1150 domain-containing protein [Paracoccus]REF67256.1 hypothetical protein BDD41_4278 [Paracoccus versutus]WGR58775.1 DUF1150 domain-containing protein [Paracoccus versutus]
MNEKFDFGPESAGNIVYIRRVAMDSLPDEVRRQVPGAEALYAVHGADGERLALVKDRSLAFLLARQNELTPVSVH